MKRLRIKIVGESGAGLLSTGEILAKALKHAGFYLFTDREYPSLIKGGHSCFTLNLSEEPIYSHSAEADIMVVLDRSGFEKYRHELKPGGLLIHAQEKTGGLKGAFAEIEAQKGKIIGVKGRDIAESFGGTYLMKNVIVLGMLWKVLGLPYKLVEAEVKEKFASKPKLLKIDLLCLKAGFDAISEVEYPLKAPKKVPDTVMLDGNYALALGAAHAGCRFYVAYPMSPSSTILTYMANMVPQTGMVVKQGEDEITVAQMSIGAMFAGTRALAATSGGGFDLMTESLSLAGIIENPWVIVIAQRPGPGTGLPTWTAQGDLKLAVHSGHGEFARLVMSVSDSEDAFYLIQHAFNYAEKYQIPVVVLTEKVIAEGQWTVPTYKEKTIPIERGLVEGAELKKLEPTDRYKITTSGLSKRWIPGSSPAYYFANGDEHLEDGTLTEDAEPSQKMYEKRNKKLDLVLKALPEPELYGPKKAEVSFVGWGSSRNVMLDAIREAKAKGVTVNYLHFTYLYPLKLKTLQKFFEENPNVHLIESNYEGQFGQMLEAALKKPFKGRLLKYNGRAFTTEDLANYIHKK